MISIQKKFLFIHVPKTGGTSIQNILSKYSEDEITTPGKFDDGIELFEIRNSKYDVTKHSTLSRYKTVLDGETYRSLFKFSVIRNPWDRMISSYSRTYGGGGFEFDRNKLLRLIKGDQALRYYICEKSILEKGLGRLGIHRTTGNRPLDGDIDFLIRFEHLDEDFKMVCGRLHIPYSPLPKRNRSEHLHYSKYYDDELREIVRQKYIEDITFGNYCFEEA